MCLYWKNEVHDLGFCWPANSSGKAVAAMYCPGGDLGISNWSSNQYDWELILNTLILLTNLFAVD